MPSGVFIKENFASSIFRQDKIITSCTQSQILSIPSFFFLCDEIFGYNEKGYPILILELTVNFAPLHPAGFVIFCGAGQSNIPELIFKQSMCSWLVG